MSCDIEFLYKYIDQLVLIERYLSKTHSKECSVRTESSTTILQFVELNRWKDITISSVVDIDMVASPPNLLSRGRILGRNWDKSLKSFPPCYTVQSHLYKWSLLPQPL